MADSSFVYLNGDPIDVGNAVENDFVYAGGQLVSDGDESDFAFIEGRGFGAGDGYPIKATLSDAGAELVSVTALDETGSPYTSGAQAYTVRGKTGETDRGLFSPQITVDDAQDDDGNALSETSTGKGYYFPDSTTIGLVSDSSANVGVYTSATKSETDSPLTVTGEFNDTSSTIAYYIGVQDADLGNDQNPENAYRIDWGTREGAFRVIRDGTVLESKPFDFSPYTNTELTLEIEWG